MKLSFLAAALMSQFVLLMPIGRAEPVHDARLAEAFYQGKVKLSHNLFGKGVLGGSGLFKLYQADRWVELAVEVQKQGYVSDLYYFYLGRAAEQLGYPEPAANYFSLALDPKIHKCATGFDSCRSFTFPNDAAVRLAALSPHDSQAVLASGHLFEPGKGPSLDSLAFAREATVSDVVRAGGLRAPDDQRGKFESEDEYTARMSKVSGTLIILPVPTTSASRCTTTYDHASEAYEIRNCVIASPGIAINEVVDGEPLVLANAFDKRSIRRVLHNTYDFKASFVLSAKFKLAAKEAEALDGDMLAGVEVSAISTSGQCEVCESRRQQDGLDRLSGDLASIKGQVQPPTMNSWRNEAFKTGSLDEFWKYSVTPSKVLRMVVFRKSDKRVIYLVDASSIPNSQPGTTGARTE